METAIKVYKEDTKIKTEVVSQQCMEAAIKVYKVCGTKECDDEHAAKKGSKRRYKD
jgi:hypothetical protein